jgi:hypothetical protein|tara:strand:+ start:1509 stop:2243 length:735 start_codon:yes stop_codon:yes gene_type:complete
MKVYHVVFLFIVLCAGVVSAIDEDYTFTQGTEIDLKIFCNENGADCSSTATCNATIIYPNNSLFANNIQFTNGGSYFNYTFPATNTLTTGEYFTNPTCVDGNSTGTTLDGEGFFFVINYSGVRSSTSGSLLFLGSLFGIASIAGLLLFTNKIIDPEKQFMKVFLSTLAFSLLIIVAQLAKVGIDDNFVGQSHERVTLLTTASLTVIIAFFSIWIAYLLITYTVSSIRSFKEAKEAKKDDGWEPL